MPPGSSLLHWWYLAKEAEIGIAIETDDIERTKAGLYKARSEAADESLKEISIVVPPGTENQLWLIKRSSPVSG